MSEDRLEVLKANIIKLEKFEEKIAEHEETLKDLKANRNQIAFVDIPELMEEIGPEITLKDGLHVKISKKWTGSISEKNAPYCFDWLRKNGHDGVIKNQIKIDAEKGKDSDMIKLQSEFSSLGIEFEHKQTVHPNTLKALINEQKDKGEMFPEEFKVHLITEAKLKYPI